MATQTDIIEATRLGFEAVQGYRRFEGKDESDKRWEDVSANYQNFWIALSDYLMNKPDASVEQIKEKAELHNELHKTDKKVHDVELAIFVAVFKAFLKV